MALNDDPQRQIELLFVAHRDALVRQVARRTGLRGSAAAHAADDILQDALERALKSVIGGRRDPGLLGLKEGIEPLQAFRSGYLEFAIREWHRGRSRNPLADAVELDTAALQPWQSVGAQASSAADFRLHLDEVRRWIADALFAGHADWLACAIALYELTRDTDGVVVPALSELPTRDQGPRPDQKDDSGWEAFIAVDPVRGQPHPEIVRDPWSLARRAKSRGVSEARSLIRAALQALSDERPTTEAEAG